MWNCKNCSEQIGDQFDSCWKCGYWRDGSPPPQGVSLREDQPERKKRKEVVLVDVDIPFRSLVVLSIKWAFASIPAILILGVLLFILRGFDVLLLIIRDMLRI
jgi:hypothetical protein